MKQGEPWKAREPLWPWRAYLTEDEAREIASIEAELAAVKRRSAELTARRNSIQNRAIQRARHSSGRSALDRQSPGREGGTDA